MISFTLSRFELAVTWERSTWLSGASAWDGGGSVTDTFTSLASVSLIVLRGGQTVGADDRSEEK